MKTIRDRDVDPKALEIREQVVAALTEEPQTLTQIASKLPTMTQNRIAVALWDLARRKKAVRDALYFAKKARPLDTFRLPPC